MNARAVRLETRTGAWSIVILVALAAVPFVAPALGAQAAIAALAVTAATFARTPRAQQHAAVLLLALHATRLAAGVLPVLCRWPLYLLVPLAAYVALVAVVPALRRSAPRVELGRLDARVLAALLVVSAGAAIALVTWSSRHRWVLHRAATSLPHASASVLVAMGIAFSFGNALLEELAWRVVLTRALESAMAPRIALVVQAASFGLAHLYGIPRGWTGVIMATAFGAALGALRLQSRGLVAPLSAHVAADATIFALMLQGRS